MYILKIQQRVGKTMELNRRDFMKANAALAAAAAAGMTIPVKQVDAAEDMGIKWDKAPCRFCGTGCSVLVGTKDGRVVATQGDPDAEGKPWFKLYQRLLPF